MTQISLGVEKLSEEEVHDEVVRWDIKHIEEIRAVYLGKANRLLRQFELDRSHSLKGYDENMEIVEICDKAIAYISQRGREFSRRYDNVKDWADKTLDKDTYTKDEVRKLLIEVLKF